MATDDWSLVVEGWDPADEGRREAILTLGNGRFATRGAAPESRADGVHYPGTYAAGCFNRLRDHVGGQTVESESMVNMPNWLDLRFAVEDGPWFAMADVEIIHHRLTLDMRRGLLVRRLRFVDAAGRHTTVRQRRFVHMGDPYLAGLQTVVTAEDWTGTLRISSGIDGAVTNAGVARYRDLAARHLTVLARREPDPSSVLLVARTIQSQLRIAVAARTTAVGGAETASRRLWQEPGRIGHELELPVRPDAPVTIDKVATLVTSRDVATSEPALTAVELLADAPGFDNLLISHELAWRPAVAPLPARPHRRDTARRRRTRRHRHPAHAAAEHVPRAAVGVAARRRPRCGHPGPGSARRGLPRTHLLGRAVRVPDAHAADAQPRPRPAAVPGAAAGSRPTRGPGGRTSRGHVPLAVRERRP